MAAIGADCAFEMITICLTYFKSLTLANLRAALYSVSRQNLSLVDAIVLVDNDTNDAPEDILETIDMLSFPVPVKFLSEKHCDPSKTHPWSTNLAVRESKTPWILFTRADYILEFDALDQFTAAVGPASFITGNVYHLHVGIEDCENIDWRNDSHLLRRLPGVENDYMAVDAGVWLMRREAFDIVGGLDESLNAWGHAQTHFQWKLHKAGVMFSRIPEVMFYHPYHSAPRDIELAHAQLAAQGVDLKEMWTRYHGTSPY